MGTRDRLRGSHDLDIESIVWLERFLKSRSGTLLMTSHDRAFPRRLSNCVLEPGGESGTEAQPHLYLGSCVEYVERTGHEAPGVHV